MLPTGAPDSGVPFFTLFRLESGNFPSRMSEENLGPELATLTFLGAFYFRSKMASPGTKITLGKKKSFNIPICVC